MSQQKAQKAYDLLIIGSGLYGATIGHFAKKAGKKVLIIDKRPHIGGNIYTEKVKGIDVHKYGAHIFHTSNKKVWDFVNQFVTFNHFVNRPKVCFKNQLFSFPINLMTLYQLWDVKTPQEAEEKLESVRVPIEKPQNLEEWVLSEVGEEIYETFIKGYTTKQWGCSPKELPTFIIRRLPIRLTFDDNYFFDPYQGIPKEGYTALAEGIMEGIEVKTGVDFFKERRFWEEQARHILYTGPIDQFFDYKFGELEYRTLRFDTKTLNQDNFQGNAVINYTEESVPYTRILEHKHFNFTDSAKTVVTWEYPDTWNKNKIPYYPVNNDTNNALFKQYKDASETYPSISFGGRLAEYKYYDMHQVIAQAMSQADKIISAC